MKLADLIWHLRTSLAEEPAITHPNHLHFTISREKAKALVEEWEQDAKCDCCKGFCARGS